MSYARFSKRTGEKYIKIRPALQWATRFECCRHCPTVSAGCSWARVVVRSMIPLSRSLVEKARGCDIDFLRCSFRLFPFKPHDGEMPSPKIGSLPGFFERSIRPEPSSAPTRIQNDFSIDLFLVRSCLETSYLAMQCGTSEDSEGWRGDFLPVRRGWR